MFGIDDAVGAAGLGLQIYGGLSAMSAAKAKAQEERNQAQFEIQENTVRRNAMRFATDRAERENTRNMQKAIAMARTNATSSGSQYGTGVKGGEYGVMAQGAQNYLGNSMQEQFGNQMFALSDQISASRMEMAKDDAGIASGQGMMSFGKSMMGSSSIFGKLLPMGN